MHIATQPGDLSATASMSEEGVQPSEHEPVGTFTAAHNPQEGIREIKKSAFEITHVQVDNETEDLDASQLQNKTITDDDNPSSPLSSDMLAASTPGKNVSSSDRDVVYSSSTLPTVTSTNINGPPHLHGSRFRKVKDYIRERWKVSDSLEVDTDEHSDISEPRSAIPKMDIASNSSSPSTPRRNASLEMASSSNLSDTKSDSQLDEAARTEGSTTLTEIPSVVTSRRASTEFSQDDLGSTEDYHENYSQGLVDNDSLNTMLLIIMYLCRTPSETNVKLDSESTSTTDITTSSIIRSSVETIQVTTVFTVGYFVKI